MGCLKNLVITAIGALGPSRGNEQLKRWVEANGGRWQPRVTRGITHVICSKDAWKKNVDAVQQAKKLSGVFIVDFDWLNDSLQKKRKLAEKKYTWEVIRKQRRTQKEMKRLAPKSDTLKFRKGCELAREDVGSGTSAPPKSGFFTSSLDDMKRRREAREAAKAITGKAMKQPCGDTEEDMETSSTQETCSIQSAGAATLPMPPVPPIQRKPNPKARSATPPVQQPETLAPSSPTTQPEISSTPTPSVFAPGLKYTPSAFSLRPEPAAVPPTPPPSTSPTTPAPPKAQGAPVTKLTDLYHIYCDGSGFEYNVLLVRHNPFLNNYAKYTLRLYESHTKPHVYATAVRYTPPAGSASMSTITANGKLGNDDFSAILGKKPKTTVDPSNATEATTTNPTPSNPEAARLTALITPPSPSATAPYNKTLTPPNSPFSPALQTFRHIFRDLTLLTWEERLTTRDHPISSPHSLQRLRAQAFMIEPFVWRAPSPGMPMGVVPKGLEGVEVIDGAYTRNRWGLPGLDEPLGEAGSVGSAIRREAEEANRKAEELERREREKKKLAMLGRKGVAGRAVGVGEKKPNYKQPLFNGPTGRPEKDEFGRYYQRTSAPLLSHSPAPRALGAGMGLGGRGGSLGASATVDGAGRANSSNPGAAATNANGRREGKAIFTQFPLSKREMRGKALTRGHFLFDR